MSEARAPLAAADAAEVAERIAAVLTADPRVARAHVTLEPDETGRLTPLGWIVPAPDWIAAARRRAQARQSGLAVKLWARVFDTAYFAGEASPTGPSYAGWTSSLTGAPIPPAEMDLWRDHTVERIRALQPRHVLEIGCGLGLLLERIAPDCESYHATDISAEAIDRLRAWAAGQPRLRHVELAQRAAHELDDLPPGSVDTVIINSVVQYFPDFDYLSQVLAAVARLLSPGGQVFLGDVRDVRLLEAFNAAVALAGATATATAGGLRRTLHAKAETELAVDPLGLASAGRLAGYGGARVLLKHQGGDNEMTRYRVDVVLRGGLAGPAEVSAIAERAWDPGADSAATLPIRDPADRTPLLLRGILNARLAADLAAARVLRTAPADTPVAMLRAAIAASRPAGQDPGELVRQAERRGHRAEATGSVAPERFDLLLSDPALPPPALPVAADGAAAAPASDPLLARLAAPLLAALAEAVADGVPDWGAVTLAAVPALPALG